MKPQPLEYETVLQALPAIHTSDLRSVKDAIDALLKIRSLYKWTTSDLTIKI